MTKGSGGGSQLQQQRREVDMQAVGGRFVFLLFVAALAFVFLLCHAPGLGAKYHKFLAVDTAEVVNSWADRDRRDVAPTGTLKKEFHNVQSYGDLPELFDPIEEDYMKLPKKLMAVTGGTIKGTMAAQHTKELDTWTVKVTVTLEQCDKNGQDCKEFAAASYSVNRIRYVEHWLGSTAGSFADAKGTAARFNSPTIPCIATDTGLLFLPDYNNNKIRKADTAGDVTTFTGDGTSSSTNGTGTAATHNRPIALTVDTANTNMYCSEYNGHVVRLIVLSSADVTTIAGTAGSQGSTDGTGADARFNYPWGSAFAASSTLLYLFDYSNNLIRAVTTPGAVVSTWAGTSIGLADGTGTTSVQFNGPIDAAYDATNAAMFIDSLNDYRIRRATVPGAVVTSPVGDGTNAVLDGVGTSARFQYVWSIVIDSSSTVLFVGERTANKVRRIVIASLTVTTVIGSGTGGMTNSSDPLTALLNQPRGLEFSGDVLYIVQSNGVSKAYFASETAIPTTAAPVVTAASSSNSSNATTQSTTTESATTATTETATTATSNTTAAATASNDTTNTPNATASIMDTTAPSTSASSCGIIISAVCALLAVLV